MVSCHGEPPSPFSLRKVWGWGGEDRSLVPGEAERNCNRLPVSACRGYTTGGGEITPLRVEYYTYTPVVDRQGRGKEGTTPNADTLGMGTRTVLVSP